MQSTNKLLAGIALASMLSAAGPAKALVVLDQEYVPDPSLAPAGNAAIGQDFARNVFTMGQTFAVGVTGTLAAIEVFVSKPTDIFEDLTLDIRTPAGTLPGLPAATLASATQSPGGLPDYTISTIRFDVSGAGIDVTAGDFLSFVLSSSTQHTAPSSYFGIFSGAEGGYDGGEGFLAQFGDGTNFATNYDMVFRSFVDVPEPGSLAMLGLGVFGAATAHRRRLR